MLHHNNNFSFQKKPFLNLKIDDYGLHGIQTFIKYSNKTCMRLNACTMFCSGNVHVSRTLTNKTK